MRLGVFGSRTICDVRAALIIAETIQSLNNVTHIVTTQEPRGVCEVTQHFAIEKVDVTEWGELNSETGQPEPTFVFVRELSAKEKDD
ncbi:MAG: hypothetical protein LBG58_02035, partial [Planctomycetaceae bacterium]|nr:hypothetical protein [Planctomycetaceae bacterium]